MRNSSLNIETTHELYLLTKRTLELYASKRKSKNMLVPRILKKSLMLSLTLSILLLEQVIAMASISPLRGKESMPRIWKNGLPHTKKTANEILNLMLSNPKDG
jgi:hypothetical protein